jgi:hypothetical protein
LLGVVFAKGQAAAQGGAEQKPLLAEQAFKNVQILRGIPVDEFMDSMGFFAAATGMNCTDCHTEESGGDWAKYADDTPLKQRARMMIVMMRALNGSSFAGKRRVTCWTCHRGTTDPETIPDFAIQYRTTDKEPDEIIALSRGPSVDQVLGKYMQALGGAQRVSNLTSFAGKGVYSGYDTLFENVPIEIFAKAPDQSATILHMVDGDDTTIFDGRFGWRASVQRPVPLTELTGGNLDGAKIEAEVSFPARIEQSLIDWRVGSSMIDDKEVQVLQGRLIQGGLPIKLYFDLSSGLLVRLIRYSDTPVGVVPTQIDYADYRDVSGLKMPFHWVVTWTDGRSTIDLSELRVNVPIDATRFAKPANPTAPGATKR